MFLLAESLELGDVCRAGYLLPLLVWRIIANTAFAPELGRHHGVFKGE
jgi:hypothetical protein